jgi:hypothetical protein
MSSSCRRILNVEFVQAPDWNPQSSSGENACDVADGSLTSGPRYDAGFGTTMQLVNKLFGDYAILA